MWVKWPGRNRVWPSATTNHREPGTARNAGMLKAAWSRSVPERSTSSRLRAIAFEGIPDQPELFPDEAMIAAVGHVAVGVGEHTGGAHDHRQHFLGSDRIPGARQQVEIAQRRTVDALEQLRSADVQVGDIDEFAIAAPAPQQLVDPQTLPSLPVAALAHPKGLALAKPRAEALENRLAPSEFLLALDRHRNVGEHHRLSGGHRREQGFTGKCDGVNLPPAHFRVVFRCELQRWINSPSLREDIDRLSVHASAPFPDGGPRRQPSGSGIYSVYGCNYATESCRCRRRGLRSAPSPWKTPLRSACPNAAPVLMWNCARLASTSALVRDRLTPEPSEA